MESKYRKILLVVLISIAFYVGLQNISSATDWFKEFLGLFTPLYVGCAIAFVLNVPMEKIEEKLLGKWKCSMGQRRVVAFFLSLLLVVAVAWIAIAVILPELIETIQLLVTVQLPKAVGVVGDWIVDLEHYLPYLKLETLNWDTIMEQGITMLQNVGSGMVTHTVSIIGAILSGITTVFIGAIFAIYILFQKERLSCHFRKVLFAFVKKEHATYIVDKLKLSKYIFSQFISGQCTEAVILGSMFFVAMSIFGLPYPLLVGVLIAITALIPLFGAFIGLGIGFLLILMANPLQAIGFIILFFVLQQIEGNFIYPYVVGNTVGLPAIWVLVAVTIGGNMFGVLGMLLFIPLFSILYAILREIVGKKLTGKQVDSEFITIHYPNVWRKEEVTEAESKECKKNE